MLIYITYKHIHVNMSSIYLLVGRCSRVRELPNHTKNEKEKIKADYRESRLCKFAAFLDLILFLAFSQLNDICSVLYMESRESHSIKLSRNDS